MNIALDRYLITKKSRPLLVAELSCNHCGSLILAKKIIKEAKMQGADLIKFQTYEPETMTLKSEKSVFKIKKGLWKNKKLWELYDKKDLLSVQQSLKNEKITTGAYVEKFEKKINQFLKCKYSLSCNSGTSALFLAFKAIDLSKNDKVIMPSINFISSYNTAKLFGAQIYLADVDKSTGQMTPDDIEVCCKKFKLKNVKALVVMYNGGYPQNADKFYKLKKKYGFKIIEDGCHALGAEYIFKKKIYKIGSCKHSDISTFSLHPLKTITTGEGGLITSNKKNYYLKIKKLRSHGIEKNKQMHWKYNVVYNSLNFRLTDFQCALGITQLDKIKKFVRMRRKISEFYRKKLRKNKNFSFPNHNKNYLSSHHLFIFKYQKL